MNDTKQHDCVCVAVSGSFILILFPSSLIPEYFKVKTSRSDISMVCSHKLKSLLTPFSYVFSPGLPCQQNGHTGLQPLWRSILLLLK